MRYFVDTEFEERGSAGIDLISIAIVAEDGREYYAEVPDKFINTNNPWLRENVLPYLVRGEAVKPRPRISQEIVLFIGGDPKPEFWGYYAAYDYVVMVNIFGGMAGWPRHYPYMFYDLRQALDHAGLDEVKQDDDSVHNALDDARWVRDTFDYHFTYSRFMR